MSTLDSIAAILLGVYLLAVAVRGNARVLLEEAAKDKAFLPWIVALGVLLYLYSIPTLKGPVSLLIAAAIMGFALQAGANFNQNVAALWNSLRGKEA